MPNTDDFDPAEAIRKHRAAEETERQCDEAEERRIQAMRERNHADILKTLRYADEQLEGIRNPVVSEFVFTEKWFRESGFFRKRTKRHERQTRYYGSWLALGSTTHEGSNVSSKRGIVKLREPRVGYAFVQINDGDLRNVVYLDIRCTNIPLTRFGADGEWCRYSLIRSGNFRIVASLEEAADTLEGSADSIKRLPSQEERDMASVGKLTKAVGHALNFVETSQPPKPEVIPFDY